MASKRAAGKKSSSAKAKAALTNPEKVLFPRDGIVKREVVEYYRAVAKVLVPHLKGRPIALQRWPDGIDAFAWFQQNAPVKVPDFVHVIDVGGRKHLSVDNEETLAWIANLAGLTIHQWSSHLPNLERPDYVVLDLDPGAGTWADLLAVAKVVRKLLDELELESVPKTSGKRGLHVFVPIARRHSHERALRFAESIARRVAEALPEIATTERSKAKRKGRLYVDYMQNMRGKTMVAPYTIRALDGAPVSAPLLWKEVGPKLDPSAFTLRTMLRRLEKHGDLFAPVLSGTARLP
jgi:bifunctional non-homologous end joining protein LigD